MESRLKTDREYAKEKGRKGGQANKGGKKKLTRLKEAIGIDKTNLILAQLERNVEESINSNDPKIRHDATKAFMEYYKPKRSTSEVNVKTKVTIVFENIKDV